MRRLAESLTSLGSLCLYKEAHRGVSQDAFEKLQRAYEIRQNLPKELQHCETHAHTISKLGLCYALQVKIRIELVFSAVSAVSVYNRPFPSCPKPHANETHYNKKDFALSLIMKVRVFVTRKWPFLLLPLHNVYERKVYLNANGTKKKVFPFLGVLPRRDDFN